MEAEENQFMNAMDDRKGHDKPAPSANKTGIWSFTFPDGETLKLIGPAGGKWAVIRNNVRYTMLLTFDYRSQPIVVCRRRICPAKPYETPTAEQDGLKSAIWVKCPSKEES